jgi:hypothetical protein
MDVGGGEKKPHMAIVIRDASHFTRSRRPGFNP